MGMPLIYKAIKVLAVIAVLFYILCWLTNQPTKMIWGIGISLPWLSLFAAIPITILGNVEEKDNWKIWCYAYALATLLYINVVLFLGGNLLHLLPHLVCCIFGILATRIFHAAKR